MYQSPVRIAVDARPLSGPPCGYTIYLESILRCLRKAEFEITLVSMAPLLPLYAEVIGLRSHVIGGGGSLRWEQLDLPNFLATERPDLYFSGANRGIPIRKRPQTRYILGLLDVIPFLFFRNYYLQRWKTLLRHPGQLGETLSQLIAAARADAILTISQQSAIDIRRLFRRRNVTPHLIRLKDIEAPPIRAPEPRFAYVGGMDARKRVDVLLRAFALFRQGNPEHRLVLVGSNYAAAEPLISELGLGDHVTLTGYVDDDTKYRILSGSLAMVYPSLYEGYGMAIAEGFQACIPVIAGIGGSQEEVGGEGIRTIDPLSVQDVVSAMTEMLDPTVRANWVRKGQAQLARLTSPAIEVELTDYFRNQAALARRYPLD